MFGSLGLSIDLCHSCHRVHYFLRVVTLAVKMKSFIVEKVFGRYSLFSSLPLFNGCDILWLNKKYVEK